MGFVVSKGGIFGRVSHHFRDNAGTLMCMVSWESGCVPVPAFEVKNLRANSEYHARREAMDWVNLHNTTPLLCIPCLAGKDCR